MNCYYYLEDRKEWIKGHISTFDGGHRVLFSSENKEDQVVLWKPEYLWGTYLTITGFLHDPQENVYLLYGVDVVFDKRHAK